MGHFVQFHDGDATTLLWNVAKYLACAFEGNEGVLVIAAPEHRERLLTELAGCGVDTDAAMTCDRLVMLDAQSTLSEFMLYGQPSEERFKAVVGGQVARVRASGAQRIRAYGEMVAILWSAGEYTAAIRLEELWNDLLQDREITLFCSYQIDIFGEDFQIHGVESLLCDHTHLLPCVSQTVLQSSLSRALDEWFGDTSGQVKSHLETERRAGWGEVPAGEAMILEIRRQLPDDASSILALARRYYNDLVRPVAAAR